MTGTFIGNPTKWVVIIDFHHQAFALHADEIHNDDLPIVDMMDYAEAIKEGVEVYFDETDGEFKLSESSHQLEKEGERMFYLGGVEDILSVEKAQNEGVVSSPNEDKPQRIDHATTNNHAGASPTYVEPQTIKNNTKSNNTRATNANSARRNNLKKIIFKGVARMKLNRFNTPVQYRQE